MTPMKSDQERGFSFVEVLIGMGITGVIITGIAALFFRATEQAMLARDDSRMTIIAAARIDELRRVFWDDTVPPDWTNGWHPASNGVTTYMGPGSPVYCYRWDVQQPWVDSPQDKTYGPFGRVVTVEVWRRSDASCSTFAPGRRVRLTQVNGCATCKL